MTEAPRLPIAKAKPAPVQLVTPQTNTAQHSLYDAKPKPKPPEQK